MVALRSPHDREIVRLALPALGALAAEPLYVLADTAIVGHLGRPQIAALGLAGTVLAGSFTIFNFLTYGTTAVVARASGAGRQDEAARLAAQALWASRGIGVALLIGCEIVAAPLLRGLGGHGRSGHFALIYFRIAAAGLPAALIALAGQGYLRGVSNLRRPLEIVVIANVVNLVLEMLFVYGFGWGIAGSAAGTAVAQAGMGVAFVVALLAHALPRAFTNDPRVLHQAALLWPFLAAMQPLGGAVFALDGILIGAGDTRFLMWSMLAASGLFVLLAALALSLGWGVVGVWAALDVLIVARLALLGPRFARRRWAVVGWN